MIGCTKLLCGTATVSDAVKFGRDSSRLPPHMLQFSSDRRPIVVWNITNKCNLRCKHCYISAEDKQYRDELTTEEAIRFIDDLAEMKVPVLLFSGGEPLLRKDIYELGKYAQKKGLRVVISSNGTLITEEVAAKISDAGFAYVGVSIDGKAETHDEFRQMDGGFMRAIQGIKNCLATGIKAGVRLTLNKHNADELLDVIDILVAENVPRFCMYHLVYSGRGEEIMQDDVPIVQKRQIIDSLLDKTMQLCDAGIKLEILTVDNHADGAYILKKIMREQPERTDEVLHLLKMHGGCSAGRKIANVDPLGNVHPCQFWSHVSLGNVRERAFSEIWNDENNGFLAELRVMKEKLKGKCGVCRYKEICGGCRIRAEVVHGDMWAEDPMCYLTDEEIR